MKVLFFFSLLAWLPACIFCQQIHQDSVAGLSDTAAFTQDSTVIRDSVMPSAKQALLTDTGKTLQDTITVAIPTGYPQTIEKAIQKSTYLNAASQATARSTRHVNLFFTNNLFYILLTLVLALSFLRLFYDRYFSNLFSVFFNTSLRQGQLTDQLLQAKQASMFFNILFAITAGIYTYLLLLHYQWISTAKPAVALSICIVSIMGLYSIKFLTLKITGWLTGQTEATNTYLFVIFLINKILGILLLPFVIIMAYADFFLQYPAVLVSLLLVAIMFLLRFFRSYSLVRRNVKVSVFHFIIYITGIEVMPLLLIYKGLMVFFNKNL